MNKRIDLIDIAKGISIILVVFCHSKLRTLYPDLNDAMALFRMPLFFFLAGVIFKASLRPTAFILRKTDILLKPYFVTLFAFLIIPVVSGGKGFAWLAWKIQGILYGTGYSIGWMWGPLWFLTHLWCLFIVSYFLFYYTKLADRSNLFKGLLVICLILVGSYFVDTFWHLKISVIGNEVEMAGLPFSLDIIFLSMAFFLSGSFLRQKVIEFKPRLGILSCVIALFLAIAINTNALIDLNVRIYKEPIYATLAAISGIYIILSIAYYFCKSKLLTTVFTTCGSASLFILIFHKFINKKSHKILDQFSGFENELVLAIVAFSICILVPILFRKLILSREHLKLLYFPINSKKLSN